MGMAKNIVSKASLPVPNGMEQTRESALDHQEKKELYNRLV